MACAVTSHEEDLKGLKEAHANALNDAHDRATTASAETHAAELEQLKVSHEAAIAELKKQHLATADDVAAEYKVSPTVS